MIRRRARALVPGLLLLASCLLVDCRASAPAAPPAPPSPAASAPAASGATTVPVAAGRTASSLGPLTPPVDVRIGLQSSISDAGVYVAIAKGYFRELGLNATAETFAGGAADYVQFIATNQLQVGGPSSVPALYNAADRGATLHIVADKGKLRTGFGFVRLSVRKELHDNGAVTGLPELKGRTIAVAAPYGAAHSLGALALRRIGFADDDASFLPLPNPDHIAALANGSIDAAVSVEPIPTLAVQQGAAVVLADGDALRPDAQVGLLAMSDEFFRNREAALRFMVAYLRGVRDYNDAFVKGIDKAQVVGILVENTAVKDPVAYEQTKLAGLDPAGSLNVATLREDFDWLKSIGQLAPGLQFPEPMFDQTLVREAGQILGPYQ